MSKQEILKAINKLPPEKQRELLRYIQQLLAENDIHVEEEMPKKELGFSWAGALSHLKDKFTSTELEDWGNEHRTLSD